MLVMLAGSPVMAWQNQQKPEIILNAGGHTARVSQLLFTPDASRLISVSEDKTVRLWNPESGALLRTLYTRSGEGPMGMLYAGALSPDGQLLAIGGYPAETSQGSYFYLISMKSFQIVGMAGGLSEVVSQLAFTHDGKYVACATEDGTISLWDVQTATRPQKKITFVAPYRINALAFHPKTYLLATALADKRLHLYDFGPGNKAPGQPALRTLRGHDDVVNCVDFSADGQFMATGGNDKKILLWEAKGNFSMLAPFEALNNFVRFVRFSDDSRILVGIEGAESSGKIFSVANKSLISSFSGTNETFLSAAFQPSAEGGNYVIASSGGNKQEIRIWNPISGKDRLRIRSAGSQIGHLSFATADQLLFRLGDTSLFRFDWKRVGIERLSANTKTTNTPIFGKIQDQMVLKPSKGKDIRNHPDQDGPMFTALGLPDGRIVVGSLLSLKIYASDGRILKDLVGHQGAVQQLALSPDGRYIASGGTDQTIQLWDPEAQGHVPSAWDYFSQDTYHEFFRAAKVESLAKTATREAWQELISRLKTSGMHRELERAFQSLPEMVSPFVTLFATQDGEWICWTPEGYFHRSGNGGNFFGWRINKSTHELADFVKASQYDDILLRPDALATSLEEKIAVSELLRRQGERVFDLTRLGAPSAIEILSPTAFSKGATIERQGSKLSTADTTIWLPVSVADGGGGVREVRIYHNGKLVVRDRELPKTMQKGDSFEKKYAIGLQPDENEVKAIVLNMQGVESYDDNLKITYTGKIRPNSNLHILAIGINEYANVKYNLNYARPDAEALTKKLQERGSRLYKQVILHTLMDQQATAENIRKKFEEVAHQANPADLFVFFYAGHGSIENSGGKEEYFMVPHNCLQLYGDTLQLQQKAISKTQLEEFLTSIKAQKQLIILDACHSGSAVRGLSKRRGLMEEKAITQLARSTGSALIASSGSQQYAVEFDVLRHGVFTYALLEALDGKADRAGASTEKDRLISVNELVSYLEDRVPELSEKYGRVRQNPTKTISGDDFPIVVVD